MSEGTKTEYRALKRSLKNKKEDLTLRLINSVIGQASCRYCPPWKVENQRGRSRGRHGPTKRRYKMIDRNSPNPNKMAA